MNRHCRRGALAAGRRGRIDHRQHSGDDVVDVGEVAAHLAAVEDPDRPARQDRLGEKPIGHVRPAPWAVDGEEAKRDLRNAEELGVDLAHHLLRLLGRRIERARVFGLRAFVERNVVARAVDRARRRIDQLLEDAGVAKVLEKVQMAEDIGVQIRMRIVQRVANIRLRRQVNDDVESARPSARQTSAFRSLSSTFWNLKFG